jgi:hypothetical protein
MGVCIGRKNYLGFLWMLILTFFFMLLNVVSAFVSCYVAFIVLKQWITFAFSIVYVSTSSFFFVCDAGLLIYHLRIYRLGLTTLEHVRQMQREKIARKKEKKRKAAAAAEEV